MTSMFRQRFVVTVDGIEHKIVTSARDAAEIQGLDDLTTQKGTLYAGMRMAHAACLRLGVDVPASFEAFVDELDGLEAVDGDAASSGPQDAPGDTESDFPGLPDPTHPAG